MSSEDFVSSFPSLRGENGNDNEVGESGAPQAGSIRIPVSMITSVDENHLEALIVSDIGPSQKRGRQPFWHCPFHDDRTPSLTITPDGRHWKCFGCGGSGDAIDWVMARTGCSFKEAVAQLGGRLPERKPQAAATGRRRLRESPRTPDPDWQSKAEIITSDCAKTLTTPEGIRARVWLINRGLRPETLAHWRIGFNAHEGTHSELWVERGITIPWSYRGGITAINVRRPKGTEKYKLVKGSSRQGLFLGDAIVPGRPTLLLEGEFDALLGWQAVGDLINVATLGSATARPDRLAIQPLITSPIILVAYDADQAGRQGAEFWQSITARVHRVPIPSGKDLTEFHQRGGDVARWIRGQLDLAGYQSTQIKGGR